ncbi:hypothetical protein GYMLUDRAFT_603206 [Collybiopsis luxurians FD-317 M1]|uniref:Uncharacterized protein n=1 Tax=Collybiopsis luxurians FD-317 M1 TaxID=944289 RepID=A0A0D0CCT4_9AGAR|nr:hypothetical protein GYMLUDRAFT_603206 [Collybiopsis luxurians FD-317 M1]
MVLYFEFLPEIPMLCIAAAAIYFFTNVSMAILWVASSCLLWPIRFPSAVIYDSLPVAHPPESGSPSLLNGLNIGDYYSSCPRPFYGALRCLLGLEQIIII